MSSPGSGGSGGGPGSRATALASALAAAFRRVGTAIADAWFLAPLWGRRALAGLLAAAALIAVLLALVLPNAPCAFSGGDRCPPGDDAIELVPADASAYVHANLDHESDQLTDLIEIAGRFGMLRSQVLALGLSVTPRPIDYEADVRPWSGGEVAAVIDASAAAQPLLMFDVIDGEGAARFAERLQKGEVVESEIDGVTVRLDSRGTATALVSGFLLVGSELQVGEAIQVAAGADSLADDEDATLLLAELPENRVAEAYLSEELTRFLGSGGQLDAFDTFVNAEASSGVALSISAGDSGLGLAVRSGQDPERAEASPDFFTALPAFDPKLTEHVGADALAYLGIGNPAESAALLVEEAASFSPALFGGLERFNRQLRRREGVEVERDLLPLLTGEAALTVEPEVVPTGGEGDPPSGQQTGIPYLALLTDGVDRDAAVADLAALEAPLADAIDPGTGRAPAFETSEIAGVEAHGLRLSRLVDLTYAAYDDRLLIATSPLAVERALAVTDPLAGSEEFKQLTGGFPERSSLLLFLDLGELVLLGERAFLAEDPAYAPLAPDVRLLEAAALSVSSGERLLATDLRVSVGAASDPISDPAPAFDVAPG